MPNPDELADAIEATREQNKLLWQELAQYLNFDFKPERRHNDIIITMLRVAGAKDAPFAVKYLLKKISANDRKISDLVAELARDNS